MKTNVIMKSVENRELFGVTIRQETKDSFLSLTDLQNAYNEIRNQNGWCEKNISMMLKSEGNVERIYYLLKEQKLINLNFLSFMENVNNDGLIKVLKGLEVYKTSGRGDNKQVMCNPAIWMLIAMEFNPVLYAKVISWLTDELIHSRVEACDLNNSLRSTLAKNIKDPDYAEINRQINIKVFGYHETGMRNLASEENLKKLNALQNGLTFCIERGYISTNEEVLAEINK